MRVMQQAELGTGGLMDWALDNAVPILFLGVALVLLWIGGARGDNAGVMTRVGGLIAGLAVLGLAVGGGGVDIGTFIAGLFTNNNNGG